MQTPNYRSVCFGHDVQGAYLRLLDQTLLPTETKYLDCRDVQTVWEAIKQLRVRGAPAIGIAVAYGVLLSKGFSSPTKNTNDLTQIIADIEYLKTSRPTAVNLFWALDRMERTVRVNSGRSDLLKCCRREADAILQEDISMCHAIGKHGAELFKDGFGILTHCNTGGLATSEYGTALSTIITAYGQGKRVHVYADETRPLLQGSRLTMWELQQQKIPATLICDNMAGQVMREGRIQAVIVGADRITANGDVANKIGTYSVAVLAKHHGIPFYVAAPTSTFDMKMDCGDKIPIEQRGATEVTNAFGKRTAPESIQVYNPAFDVTPAELVSAIVTEKGLIQPVCRQSIESLLRLN